MTNSDLLKQKIYASGLKIGYIASCLNISRQTLWKKISNKSLFNQNEISLICKLLKINEIEKELIFFTNEVD